MSSANYGPEEAFLALGSNTHLAVYLAVAISLTVFLISLGYNEVIALFPSGRVRLQGCDHLDRTVRRTGSGSALIVDYALTIAISVASGVDALFSLLPLGLQTFKVGVEIVMTLGLMISTCAASRSR